MSFENLSYPVIKKVLDELCLKDALHASVICQSWRKILLEYLFETYNPVRYLSDIFPEPKSMLNTFRKTGAILSGSRGLAYFLPSLRHRIVDSDWDIFVPSANEELLHLELQVQSFKIIPREKPQPQPARFTVYNYLNYEKQKVQLVVLKECSFYECLINFHMSIVMNCITGRGAYSKFWKSTFEGRGWTAERLDGHPEYRNEQIEKYAKKGIRLVQWAERDELEYDVFAVYWNEAMGKCLTDEEFQVELAEYTIDLR
jgi:hypothetical protein